MKLIKIILFILLSNCNALCQPCGAVDKGDVFTYKETTKLPFGSSIITNPTTTITKVEEDGGFCEIIVAYYTPLPKEKKRPNDFKDISEERIRVYKDSSILYSTHNSTTYQVETIEEVPIVIPHNLESATIPDAKHIFKTKYTDEYKETTDANLSDIVLKTYFSEIKVEGKENLTTSAGTFECIKITYVVSGSVAYKLKQELWYSPLLGVPIKLTLGRHRKKYKPNVVKVLTEIRNSKE